MTIAINTVYKNVNAININDASKNVNGINLQKRLRLVASASAIVLPVP